MKPMFSPSLMCMDLLKIREQIQILNMRADFYHIDIMDGEYVPNYTLGTDYVRQLRKTTDIPLDVHLMINNPERKIAWFDFQEGEYV